MNKKAALVLSLVLIALLLLIHGNQNYALSAKSKKDLSDSSSSFSPNKSKEIIDRKNHCKIILHYQLTLLLQA
jgi:hypothetical protein